MMKMNVFFLGLFFFSAFFFSACQPRAGIEVLGPPSEDEKTSLAEKDPLETRIRALKERLFSDDLESEDRRMTNEFIKAYEDLRRLDKLTDPDADEARYMHRLIRQLISIEDQYFARKYTATAALSPGFDLYYQKRSAIFESFLLKDYPEVIRQCLALKKTFGEKILTPDIGLVFALSLAEDNRVLEAIEIGDKVMEQIEDRPDLWQLRSALIEWYLAEGKQDRALTLYGKLSDDLDEKKVLYSKSGSRLIQPQAKGAPAEKDQTESENQKDSPLQYIIQEAKQLAQKQAFTEAKLLLIKARIKTENDSDIEALDQALKEIDLSQRQIEKGKDPVTGPSAEERLGLVTSLIEEEKYEEAISSLEKIERAQIAPDAETRRLKTLAMEKIINRDRNKAAQLYLQAKHAQDPVEKKELLQSSLDMLKSLVDKYPSSYLIERINSHIAIVEEALGDL